MPFLRRLRPVAFTCAAFGAGCSAVDADATLVTRCPDEQDFAMVSPVIEASCGTLDCHGQLPRPLRVYGERGLRLQPWDVPGDATTTFAEMTANRQSICSLEPERTSAVVAGGAPPESLLVLQKARGDAHHKGGAPIHAGGAADVCIQSWFAGSVDAASCAAVPTPQP